MAADTESVRLAVQFGALVLSGAGVVVGALVKRSVAEQDKKLDAIGAKVDAITEKVSEHASKLARGSAKIEELERRAQELEQEVRGIARHGCARMCPTPVPHQE